MLSQIVFSQEKRQSLAEDAATATCPQLQSPNDTALNETLSALREAGKMRSSMTDIHQYCPALLSRGREKPLGGAGVHATMCSCPHHTIVGIRLCHT